MVYGAVLGYLGSWVHSQLNSPATEVLLTVFLAFAAVTAEHFHFSGVIALRSS